MRRSVHGDETTASEGANVQWITEGAHNGVPGSEVAEGQGVADTGRAIRFAPHEQSTETQVGELMHVNVRVPPDGIWVGQTKRGLLRPCEWRAEDGNHRK